MRHALGKANARFCTPVYGRFIPDRASDCMITMRPGDVFLHSQGGPTEEGWSRNSEEYRFDGVLLHLSLVSSGVDCDGRMDHFNELIAELPDDDMKYPEWHRVSSSQRDHTAESMNY